MLGKWKWTQAKNFPLLVVLVAALLLGSLWLFAWRQIEEQREQTLREASREAMNLAKAFEANVQNIMDRTDADMQLLIQAYLNEGPSGRTVHQLLAHTAKDPSRHLLGVVGESGLYVVSSDPRTHGVDYSDREYFASRRAATGDELFVGQTIVSRSSGKTVIPLSRRISKADGSFGGVVQNTIDTGYFAGVFSRLEMPAGSLVALVGMDGFIRFRQLQGKQSFGQDLRNGEIFRNTKVESTGVRLIDGAVDGVKRLFAYRVMPDYPLLIIVGFSYDVVMTPFENYKKSAVYGTTGLSLLIFALAFLIIRQHHRQNRVQAEQLQQNSIMNTLLDNLASGVFMVEAPSGRPVIANLAAKRLLGQGILPDASKDNLSEVYRVHKYGSDEPYPVEEMPIVRGMYGEAAYIDDMIVERPDGSKTWLEVSGSPIRNENGDVWASLVSFQDITDRKTIEGKMRFLSYHDALTGLFNRAYFEEELRRREKTGEAELGLILFDLDGLKLVNDSFGHQQGDDLLVRSTELIRNCFAEDDLMARIGGAEFAVLLSRTNPEQMEAAISKVYAEVEKAKQQPHRIPISLSAGAAFRSDASISVRELFREADDKMYRSKLHRSQSTRSTIVQTAMAMLEARDFITEGHADRLQEMLLRLAKAAGLPESRMDDLRLLAQFHDIGKVGIPDRILLKPGPLTEEEMVEMRRHSEIGHRIAKSSPDLLPVSEWVLKHHEWWNGEGYPLGLSGEQIPIECRILAIVDAYDAMTSDRPYRKAMEYATAAKELRRCAGTQFDPALVELFIATFTDKQAAL